MIKVPPLTMQETDRWPVERAGLPRRLVRALTRHGLHTIGDLRRTPREVLRKLPGAGAKSVERAMAFLARCEDIEAGNAAFRDFDDALTWLVPKRPRWVLARRCGLYRPDAGAARAYCTLQEIANEDGLTRERVRQMERQALEALSSLFAVHATIPFRRAVRAAVESHGGIADADVLCAARPAGFGRCNPASAALLLADAHPADYLFCDGVFSAFDADTLDTLRARLLDVLRADDRPRTVAPLAQALCLPASAVRVLLRHTPGALIDRDGRVFLSEPAAARWIAEHIKSLDRPAHFRDIAHALNGHLEPSSQKGARYFLDKLSANPIFVRTQHGMYDLAHETD